MKKIKIGNKYVGEECPCFIIAEAGVNHNGEIRLAKKLVDAAANAGADAVKFQTFKAERIVTPSASMASYQKNNTGKNQTQYEMLKNLELTYDDFKSLKEYCNRKGIIFLSTPHSCVEDIDLVSKLSPAIKIGSGDLTNLPFLEYAAKKRKPIIIGTGMASLAEVGESVRLIRRFNKDLVVMHCTTNYPTNLRDVNLRAMDTIKKEFNVLVGYSDHTEGIMVSLIARAMGACVIEKHFTLDRNLSGPDHKASLEPVELKELIDGLRLVEIILGSKEKKPTMSEKSVACVVRKSIVAKTRIQKGSIINAHMLTVKRPGTGIQPSQICELLGRTAKRTIEKDELLKPSDFE